MLSLEIELEGIEGPSDFTPEDGERACANLLALGGFEEGKGL